MRNFARIIFAALCAVLICAVFAPAQTAAQPTLDDLAKRVSVLEKLAGVTPDDPPPDPDPLPDPQPDPDPVPDPVPGGTFAEAYAAAPVDSAGTRQVILAPGTYKISARFELRDRVTVRALAGSPAGAVTIRYTGTKDNECFGVYAAAVEFAGIDFNGVDKTHLFRVWGTSAVTVADVRVVDGGGLCRLSNDNCELTARNIAGQGIDNFIYVSAARRITIDGWLMRPPADGSAVHEHGLRCEGDTAIEVRNAHLDLSNSYAAKSVPFAIHRCRSFLLEDSEVWGDIGLGGLQREQDVGNWDKNQLSCARDVTIRRVISHEATTRFVKKDGQPKRYGGGIGMNAGVGPVVIDGWQGPARNGGGVRMNGGGFSSVRRPPRCKVSNSTVTSNHPNDGFSSVLAGTLEDGGGNVLIKAHAGGQRVPGANAK